MSIGSAVRSMFGPAEPAISRLYRSAFTDVVSVASALGARTRAKKILEVGCGEGQLTEELARAFPDAQLTGIDVTPRAGRLYRGDRNRAQFLHQTVEDFAAAHPREYDLVIVADVLHHVPWPEHDALLRNAASAVSAGGRLAVKDWERSFTVPHLFCYLSDRVVTNDRVRYGSASELRAILRRALPGAAIEWEERLPPWRNNILFVLSLSGS